jgi:hypothetical protein
LNLVKRWISSDFLINEKRFNLHLLNVKKISKAAKDFGVKVTVNKELDKQSGKVLFPEKLRQANEVLSNTRLISTNLK